MQPAPAPTTARSASTALMPRAATRALALALPWLLAGCNQQPLQAPPPPAQVQAVPADWPAAQQARMADIARHIEQQRYAYDRFANFPVSNSDGVPFLILKLLPLLAPQVWGRGDNFLDVIGLFEDERLKGYPAARGIGFSGLARDDLKADIDYASFTCGACHIGRVRLGDGRIQYLDGGINTEFNVILYRHKVRQTLEHVSAGSPAQRLERITAAVLAALDARHQADPTWFYRNYRFEDRVFDAAYEQRQIELFRQNAAAITARFVKEADQEFDGWGLIADKLYPEIKTRVIDGFGGMEDAISFNAAHAYYGLKDSMLTRPFASLALPAVPGMTDIMAVWNQRSRNPRWNASRDDLVDGGGQWNGHIPMPMYKNIAAQLTLGYDGTDIRVSAFADQLLDALPAPAYPFPVDVALARQGQALFAQNCADCHQPNNGRVYEQIGTHTGRAEISGLLITIGAQRGFTAVCGPDTVVQMRGQPAKPCAEYQGVSLKGKSTLAMTWPKLHKGYNALPLPGIWAQAPYLHNGSVPTLYHLLRPKERPDSFIKGRLDYDPARVGYAWTEIAAGQRPEGYRYDTASSPALAHTGHDHDLQLDGKTYKLDWSDDQAGTQALLEYLKTL